MNRVQGNLTLGNWVRDTVNLLIASARAYVDDRAIRLGAGLAYYSLFALVPIMTLAVSMASIFFGQELVDGELNSTIADLVGPDIADLLSSAIAQTTTEGAEAILPLASIAILIFTGTLLFVAWREVVNIIWGVPRERGIAATVEKRLFALAAVLGSSVLLTVILFAETVVGLFADRLDIGVIDTLLFITGSFIPMAVGAVFLAVLYKFTPTVDIPWRIVWFPSIVAIALLSAGAWGYGIYVSIAGLRTAGGVAGTVFLGLALVYYGAQILLYGMEIVSVKHSQIKPVQS